MSKPVHAVSLIGRKGSLRTRSADKGDQPVAERGDALEEADEVQQVDEEPEQPGDESSGAKPTNVGHGTESRNGRHAALVVIDEFGR